MTTVVIYYGSSSISFNDLETPVITIKEIQPRIVHRLINGKPFIYYLGNSYKIIEIDIKYYYPATFTKITTLKAQTGTMQINYEYGIDTETHILGQIKKTGIGIPYHSGEKKYGSTK